MPTPPQKSVIAPQIIQQHLNQLVQKWLLEEMMLKRDSNYMLEWGAKTREGTGGWRFYLSSLETYVLGDLLSAPTFTASGVRRPALSLAAGQGVLIGQFNPKFLFPPLPYYLTLFKHYMAQQRVDRAISYPPELVLLRLCQRAFFLFIN